jgi:hypothetical protein
MSKTQHNGAPPLSDAVWAEIQARHARVGKLKFTAEEEKLLRRAINATWAQIGYDCEGLVSSNLDAVEVCIDADRLTFNCGHGAEGAEEGRAADALIAEKLKDHKYAIVLRALSKLVQLV